MCSLENLLQRYGSSISYASIWVLFLHLQSIVVILYHIGFSLSFCSFRRRSIESTHSNEVCSNTSVIEISTNISQCIHIDMHIFIENWTFPSTFGIELCFKFHHLWHIFAVTPFSIYDV